MKGANEYAKYIKTGQYGRLYCVAGEHARGSTFHVQVLPEGEKAVPNYSNMCLNNDAVEVYGIISGQPGWSEVYGWLHKGPWVKDLERLLVSCKLAEEDRIAKFKALSEEAELKKKERITELLATYTSSSFVVEVDKDDDDL